VQADLSAAVPLPVAPDASWVVDWSGLTRDALGNAFAPSRIDGLTVAFYEGMTLSELEENIVTLDAAATLSFTLEVTGGSTAYLGDARSESAEPFPGFATSSSGVWLLALTCSTCLASVPPVLAVLEPVGTP
jgi:hypothetical protein